MSVFVRRYVPPALFVLTALAVKLLLRDYVLEQESPFVLFFSAVLLSAWWGGFAVGMSATAVCAALALTLFLRAPGEGLQTSDVVRTGVFMAEGVFVSTLAEARKQQQERFRGTFEHGAVGMAHVHLARRTMRRYAQKLGDDAREFIEFAVDGVRRPLPEVNGNEVQLTQLFQNLIGNAIKFRGDEPPRIAISAVAWDAQWELTVRDHGHRPGHLQESRRAPRRRIWLDTSVSGGAAFKFTLAAAPVAVPGAA